MGNHGNQLQLLLTEEQQRFDILLEGTSRSFFLSLRVLPKKIRRHIGLTYLLARLADTIADSKVGKNSLLIEFLRAYDNRIQDPKKELPNFEELALIQEDKAESELLLNAIIPISYLDGDVNLTNREIKRLSFLLESKKFSNIQMEVIRDYSLEKSRKFSNTDREKIRICLGIIISGQSLDLQRFTDASGDKIVSLDNEVELDDYTYRVAGSVGEFWTHMSLDHLFTVGVEDRKILFKKAINFGKSLQMINILRDLPEDLKMGRCYLPRETLADHNLRPEDLLNLENMERFKSLYDNYLKKASTYLDDAITYVNMLPRNQYRLRLSCMLPILIGQKTLILLKEGNILDPNNRIKISRTEIKNILRKAAITSISKKMSIRLLNKNRLII